MQGLTVHCVVWCHGQARAVLLEAVGVEVLAHTMVGASWFCFDQLGQGGQAGTGQIRGGHGNSRLSSWLRVPGWNVSYAVIGGGRLLFFLTGMHDASLAVFDDRLCHVSWD